MESENLTETETPELLPGERTEMPDPDAVPETVTTAGAFGKPAPAKPDRSRPEA